jgi:hypothetical protein
MNEIGDLQTFEDDVIQEVRLLQGRLPEWYPTGPYADHLRPLDPLERREAERLDRLRRRERAARGESTRERAMRERARPWREEERWTLRKRVWRERRDRERELLEQRERALLDREEELARLRTHAERWLTELQELEPGARSWCADQARAAEERGITPAQLDQIHRQRAQAAERHARELLAHSDIRAIRRAALCATPPDPVAVARAITPLLIAHAPPGARDLPLPPVVVAALALLLERVGVAGSCDE